MYVNVLSTYSDKKFCHTSTTLQTSIARFVSDSWASCCYSWKRPCDYHAICCMDGKTIQYLSNPSQHVPIYLQQFPSYSNRKYKKSQFSRTAAHIFYRAMRSISAVFSVMQCPSVRPSLCPSIKHRITRKLLKIDRYMLRGVWQALNCLSIHATYCVIVAEASPGETKMWAAVLENGDFLQLRFEQLGNCSR